MSNVVTDNVDFINALIVQNEIENNIIEIKQTHFI